ncbi:MAG: DEAD/DEAH box helicase family protein [Tannerellaceae bacterium]|nr:DEAD/DEAH box helicase family protein [Tannerellaceae bacterium]
MLKNVDFNVVYASGENEPIQFFIEALLESIHLDLGLEYFCSSAIRALVPGFAYFIANGGKVRILINDELTQEDKAALEKGQLIDVTMYEKSILTNFKRLSSLLSKEDELFFNCLSYLIASKRIEFIATVSTKGGNAHDKYRIFTDREGNRVGFAGSANFSMSALNYNAETINCFTSWTDATDLKRLNRYADIFENAWTGSSSHVLHIPISRIKTYIREQYPPKQLSEIINDSFLIRDSVWSHDNNISEHVFEKLKKIETEPRFPYPEEREIQKQAYSAWIENGYKGIFAMATGAGKTITALNCLYNEYKIKGYYQALIVVPTQALAVQWEKEAKLFNFQNVISTHTENDWKRILSRYTTRSILKTESNLVVITTYATFNRKDIQDFLKSTKGINNFIYIADEVHNVGSATSLKHLPENINYRIGLSATPERIYDDAGSQQLFDFFNSAPPNYTYSYTMKQAIDDGILCHYDYFPIFVQLTCSEMSEYENITKKLRKYIDSETGTYKKEAEMLLLKRKRIVHKAENKKVAIINLLEELKGNRKLDYTFVFVPEGYEPNYSENDGNVIDEEDIHIIDEYAQIFKDRGFHYHKYISGLDDPPSILESFANGDIEILLSMKCLDEGVDIPRAEYAIFCASTGNPRQFIQRRGRVLRKSKGKLKATIWDLIVLPPEIGNQASDTERNMFKSEVKRVVNFAALADNQVAILYGELREICETLRIDCFEMLEDEYKQYE